MAFNSKTSHSPFELAYGFNPLSPLDLFPLPILLNCVNDKGVFKSQIVKKPHDKAQLHIEKKGEQYAKTANKGRKKVIFKVGTQAAYLRSNSSQEGEDDAYMEGHGQGVQEGMKDIAPIHLKDP
ncbi:hypothetical protein CR513_13223, partial [Mucuna pruriens]